MTEELLQTVPHPLGRYVYYKLGATNLSTLVRENRITARVPTEFALKRPDGLIVEPYSGVTKAYIEYKTPQQLRTKRQIDRAIEQELDAARCLCKLLIVTDGEKSHWVNTLTGNVIRDQREGSFSPFNAYQILKGGVHQEEIIELEDLLDRIDQSLTDDNDTITSPALLDPSQLAKTIWQKIWINTGKDPEKCLYNVVELFVFKFLSDLQVLPSHLSFNVVYDLHSTGSNQADREALTYYARLCRPGIHQLFPPGADDTTIINGTIFVNEAGDANPAQARLFGEVLDHLQEYAEEHGSFRHIQREFKTRLYESFLRQSAGVRFLGQYFTPRNVVRAMVEMSTAKQLPAGARICDPFCGVGGFILEAIANTPHIYRGFEPRDGRVEPEITLVGYDKGTDEKEDERTIILAKANMLIYFSELLGKYNSPEHLKAFAEDAFNRVFHLIRTNLGTFGIVNDQAYDLILTNPPYVTSGSRSLKNAIEEEGLSQYYTSGGRGTESLALEWVVRNLKPGGQGIMIVPDGLLRQQPILAYVKRECFVRGVISLPRRTFYSTDKKTSIVILERKHRIEDPQSEPVFAYIVSEIGETKDTRRWSMDQNDLLAAASLYNQFKGSPAHFSTDQLRCKVIPIKQFQDSPHWLVERLWSDADLRQLGITSEPKTATDVEFQELTEEMRGTLDTIRNLAPPTVEPAKYEEVRLGDSGRFSLSIGRRVTKRNSDGNGVPVISAGCIDRPFGYMVNPGSRARTGPALVWGIDGDFDWGYVSEGREFVPTDHCGVLEVIGEGIIPKYLYHELKNSKDIYGFDRTYRASLTNIQEVVTARIPTKGDGNFDVDAQQQIADRLDAMQSIQDQLRQQLENLSGVQYQWTYLEDQ